MVHSTKLAKEKPHMIEIDTQVRILSQDYLIDSFLVPEAIRKCDVISLHLTDWLVSGITR